MIWMNLKSITLSEWRQRQKTKYYRILFMLYSRRGKTIGIGNKISGCLGMEVKGVIDHKGE